MKFLSQKIFCLGAIAVVLASPATAQVTRNAPPPPPNTVANTDQGNIDVAYGAFQRGQYITAFNEASKRAPQNDASAMTLLGEL